MRLKVVVTLLFILVVSILLINQLFLSEDQHSPIENQSSSAQQSSPLEIIDENKYVCPMHSHILSHQAGECPICGMDLVVNKSRSSIEKIDRNNKQRSNQHSEVRISATVKHNLGIRTAVVERGDLHHRIETIGKITRVDPMARSRVTSPISGTIVKIADKYSGAKVKQDEFLFSVVSEELLGLEKAFQEAFVSGDKATASGMIPNLVAMGLDAEQVSKLQNGAEPVFPAKFYAKEDGYIFTRRGEEGDAVTSAFTVFNLGGNYQVIEVTVEIFERQWDLVKEGQAATMQLRNLPGKTFHGRVERVDEPVGYTTRALESRIKFKTDHQGMTQSTFAKVIIDGKTKQDVLMVSRDAVIRTGAGNRVVLLTDSGSFKPVNVTIGEEAEGKVEILSGLDEGQSIVISGQFLLDSESNLSTGLDRMTSAAEMSESDGSAEQ